MPPSSAADTPADRPSEPDAGEANTARKVAAAPTESSDPALSPAEEGGQLSPGDDPSGSTGQTAGGGNSSG